jgi:hypothetical protein
MSKFGELKKVHDRILVEMGFESGFKIEQRHLARKSDNAWMDFDSENPVFDWDIWEYRLKKPAPFDGSDARFLLGKTFRRKCSPEEELLCIRAGKDGVILGDTMFYRYADLETDCEIWDISKAEFQPCCKQEAKSEKL